MTHLPLLINLPVYQLALHLNVTVNITMQNILGLVRYLSVDQLSPCMCPPILSLLLLAIDHQKCMLTDKLYAG